MGSTIRCLCGYLLSDHTDAHYRVVPWRVLYTTDGGDARRLSDTLFRCPNCGSLAWEGTSRFQYFQPTDKLPRVWADLSDRDELGRVWLRDSRSFADIAAQRLQKPVRVTLYDDEGNELDGEIFDGINEDGELDPRLSAVRLDS